MAVKAIDFVFDEIQALMAAIAVSAHVVGIANQVAALAVALFTSNTAGNCVLLKLFRITQSSKEFSLILKVKLEGVTDFAVRGSGLD